MRQILSVALLVISVGRKQTRPPEIQDRFQNLGFAAGKAGEMPVDWELGIRGTRSYVAETSVGAACHDGVRCAVVKSTGIGKDNFCFLYQIVDATAYRGKNLAYRAAVRTDLKPGSVARLLVRIHRENGSTSFRDDMGNHPITARSWTFYEIDAPVIFDARDIEFGMQVFGEGSAWIDKVSVEFSSAPR